MHRSPPRLASVIAVVAAMAVALAAPQAASAERPSAPIVNAGHADAVPGSFIVVLRDGPGTASTAAAESTIAALRRRYALNLRFVYTAALNGFAVHNATARQLQRLSADPAVAYIEQDLKVSVAQPAGIASSDLRGTSGCWPDSDCDTEVVTQLYPPSWHLNRIDQRYLPLDNEYEYPKSAGSGVWAYIIGSGIRTSHQDFGGRAHLGHDFEGTPRGDCHGSGTQLAGIVGGHAYGVAKAVTLVSVRVLNCSGSGTYAGVINGINWVTHNSRTNPGMNVAVMGLGGGWSQSLNDAVHNSITAGIHYSVAAGQNVAPGDACNSSPASVPAATTVAASTSVDARASFSNFGTCVDLFAPGSMLTAPWMSSDMATNMISGTEAAAAVVAGVVALWRREFPAMTAGQLSAALVFHATSGVLTDVGVGSPNRLVYTR